jgi:regulation of enolase protein 1 (concanavalin A-like superfamily)
MIKTNRLTWLAGACLLALLACPVQAQYWTTNKLNNAAVTNASGAMIVLGTDTNVWTTGMTKEAVYDGNTATFFDPVLGQNAWAGFQLRSPKVVSRIRYIGRSGQAVRMNGVLFQGANTADFSDAVTLLTHTPPANWTGTTWIDVTLSTTNALRSFTYLRYIATAANSFGGNAAEVEFYGLEAPAAPPPTPVLSFADSANWYAHMRWTVDAAASAYEVQRRRADEADFATILTDLFRNPGATTWRDPTNLFNDTAYRVRARNSAGDSAWFAFSAAAANAATGTWIGTAGTYGGNMTGDKAYDANIDTFFDGPSSSGGNGLWTGLDLGAPRPVAGLRFTPRTGWASRMTGGQFQAADNTNFTGATTLYTIPSNPIYTNMMRVALASPVTARYVRYLSPNGGWGNVAEVEFDLAPSAPKTPTGLAIASSDLTNDYPVLTWSFDAPNVVSSSLVYSATAPGGPYTLATPSGVFGRAWTNAAAQVGVLTYYKVSAVASDANGWAEGPQTAYATYRRCQRLERDWSALGALKAGVTAFRVGSTYNNDPNVDVDKLFDGSLATSADIVPSACSVGVDFGKPYGIGWMRFSPRSTFAARVNGAVLRGSNDLAAATTLATFTNGAAGAYAINRATSSAAHRFVFATRLDGAEFYGNLAELELFGWDPDAVTNLLAAPASVSFAIGASALTVSWSASANATSYRVERMPADGSSSWSVVGSAAATSLDDASPAAGVSILYRVAALRTTEAGEEAAYSESFPAVYYVPGAGTGLRGHYYHPFTKAYDPAEALVLTRDDATVNFAWGGTTPLATGTATSVTNTLVVWYGTLLVPHAGTYTFYANTDDGVALRVDGQFVLNDWADGAAERSGSVALAAGSHTLRLDYYQASGGAAARLEWAGAVNREVIPASQLSPLALPSDDIGAWRGRTFNATKLGTHATDPATGGIVVSSAGVDLSGTGEGHHFVWQPVRGGFLLEALVTQRVDAASLSAKALLMVRSGLATGNAFLAPARMATGQLGVKARLTAGGAIADQLTPAWQGTPSNPCRLRLRRLGNAFTAEYQNTGGLWQPLYYYVDTNRVFSADVQVGFSVTSPGTTLQSAVFSEMQLKPLGGLILMVQ